MLDVEMSIKESYLAVLDTDRNTYLISCRYLLIQHVHRIVQCAVHLAEPKPLPVLCQCLAKLREGDIVRLPCTYLPVHLRTHSSAVREWSS